MTVQNPDVCIVGAGPAGALTAYSLAQQGRDVLILEAGERFDDDDRIARMEQSLRPAKHRIAVWNMGGSRDDFSSSGKIHTPLNNLRVKGVGGSTLHWGGRVARFPEKDFEMNSRYGVGYDWPIDYDDLRPYYAVAEQEFGVAGNDDNPFGPPRDEPYPMEAFPPSHSDSLFADACERLDITVHSVPNARNSEMYDGRSPCVGYGTCAPVCPSGAKYSADVHVRKAESHGAEVIEQAIVRRLEHSSDDSRITAAVYSTPDGETHRQRAEQFVLASGAIEIPRLLLLSESDSYPNGLANSSGTVGKYYMQKPYVGIYGELDRDTAQNRIGFGTTESYQFYEPDEAPPGSFKLEFTNHSGPKLVEMALKQRRPRSSIFEAIRSPIGSESLENLRDDVQPIEWGDDLLTTMEQAHGNYFGILAEIEALPYAENRVSLNRSRTDDFGDPVPDVSWGTYGEYEEQTIKRAFEVMEDIVDSIDATVKWSERREYWGGVGHQTGTTRMGTDPDKSVVTPDLRSHDLDNLFIVGGSTFVTGSASQPTLTIAALSLRLAEYLDQNVL